MSALPSDAVPAVAAVSTALDALRAIILDAVAVGEIRLPHESPMEEGFWI
jgi:hypothetical protein